MDGLQLDELLTDDLRESLTRLNSLTPEQLKTVAEFVAAAGGFENALAAMDALENLCDAA